MVEFAKTLNQARTPGTYNLYNSMDAQVLGLVLKNATGETPSDYLSKKIWSRIGAERDAYWVLDDAGNELAAGGVNVTARDYAKFGRSEEHTSELQSLMRISYAVFCFNK